MKCPQCGRFVEAPPPGGIFICLEWFCHYRQHWEELLPDRDPLLQEREKTHGSFHDNAVLWQRLCDVFKHARFLNDEQRLAAEMIFLKLARMAQHPEIKEHWGDIAGYAKLGAEACDH